MTDAPLEHLVPLPTPSRPLPTRASVAIVGGGIMGTSIAFHLAQAGVRDIVLVERDTLGSGSSAKPLGGVRATFSDPGNIVLGQRSLEAFERFDQEFRTDIGLRQVGYLFLCRSGAEADAVAQSAELQNRMGGRTRLIDPDEAATLNPYLDPRALVCASFSPRDGYARPARVVAGYLAAAEQLGVSVVEHAEVLGIEPGRTERHALHTSCGTLETETLVIAAGAWSRRLGEMVGVHLPVEPLRRLIGVTPRLEPAPGDIPFTLDLSTTLYVHGCGGGLLVGISHADQAPGFGREFSHEWVPAFDRAAAMVAPALVGLPLAGGWAGLYEDTPDHNALIGSGYDPAAFKAAIFAVAALFASLGGALFTLQVGLASPSLVGIVPSIEIVICAAVGGRLSLVGAAVGTLMVYAAKTFFSENFAEYWPYLIGGLFMAVVVFLPNGLAGLLDRWRGTTRPGARPGRAEKVPPEAGTSEAPKTQVAA